MLACAHSGPTRTYAVTVAPVLGAKQDWKSSSNLPLVILSYYRYHGTDEEWDPASSPVEQRIPSGSVIFLAAPNPNPRLNPNFGHYHSHP